MNQTITLTSFEELSKLSTKEQFKKLFELAQKQSGPTITTPDRMIEGGCKDKSNINGVPLKSEPNTTKRYGYQKKDSHKPARLNKAIATIQQVEQREAYLSKPVEPKIKPGKSLTMWEKKPFESDTWIFMDSDPDMISNDYFENMIDYSDSKYNRIINQRLRDAVPALHSVDLGQGGTIDAKLRGRQLDRMIFEDCQYSGGQIRIPQITGTCACSVPSHLRIEEMSKYMGITLKQAKTLAKIYRILDLDFNTVVTKKLGRPGNRKSLNNHIRAYVTRTGNKPWEIKVTSDGKSLLTLAKEIKALMLEDQEDPEWARDREYIDANIGVYSTFNQEETDWYYNEYVSDQEVFDSEANKNMWLAMSGEHYSVVIEPYPEAQFEIPNPIGEFTYWNNSTIKDQDYMKNSRTSRRFGKLIAKTLAFELSNEKIIKAGKWVMKRCTPIQKKEWRKVVHHVTSVRAMGEMINTMVEYQDVRYQAANE